MDWSGPVEILAPDGAVTGRADAHLWRRGRRWGGALIWQDPDWTGVPALGDTITFRRAASPPASGTLLSWPPGQARGVVAGSGPAPF